MQGLWGEARLDAMERIAPEPVDKAELTTEPKPITPSCGNRLVRPCGSQVAEETRLKQLSSGRPCKLLISLDLRSWLAALDDFRNWLIREAA